MVLNRLARLALAAIAFGLVGALVGSLIDAIRGLPGWDITAATIGLHVGLLGEAWRLGLLGNGPRPAETSADDADADRPARDAPPAGEPAGGRD